MRILLWTDAPWCKTAYGRQCRDLIRQLKGDGHEVAVLTKFGLGGGAIKWQDTFIYAPHKQSIGVDALRPVCAHFQADIVLSIYDVWAFPPNIKQFMPVPWIAYFPVDGSPVPAAAAQRLKNADWVTSYTRWGVDELHKAGIEAEYTPPGFDIDLFQPGDKHTARDELGLPNDAFIVTTVGANKGSPCRKSWSEIVGAFSLFQQDKDDVVFYAHTTKLPHGSQNGMFFDDYTQALGIPSHKLAFPDQNALFLGVPDEQMAQIYRASDVLLLPSRAEGFGFPVAEAQLCGIPVITIEAHALNEITVNGARIVNTVPQWIPQLQYWWRMPSVPEIAEKLEWYYRNRERGYFDEQAQAGRAHFVENYAHDVVWKRHWQPFIEKVEARLW